MTLYYRLRERIATDISPILIKDIDAYGFTTELDREITIKKLELDGIFVNRHFINTSYLGTKEQWQISWLKNPYWFRRWWFNISTYFQKKKDLKLIKQSETYTEMMYKKYFKVKH